MARIAGVNIPLNKRAEIGLTYIFGIGQSTAQNLLDQVGIDRDTQVKDLTEDEIIKLREASVSYRFEGGFVERMGAGSVELRLAGRNLHTWSDYSGVDPEVNLFSGSTVARGVDFVTTPIPRQVSVGLAVSFGGGAP